MLLRDIHKEEMALSAAGRVVMVHIKSKSTLGLAVVSDLRFPSDLGNPVGVHAMIQGHFRVVTVGLQNVIPLWRK